MKKLLIACVIAAMPTLAFGAPKSKPLPSPSPSPSPTASPVKVRPADRAKKLSFLSIFISTAYADGPVASPSPSASPSPVVMAPAVQAPNADDFSALLKGIGGVKGAGTLVIVALIVQALMFFFRTSLASFAGVWQLVIVNGLTLLGGILALKIQGMDWLSAILNSQILAAAQVWGHQIFSQIQKKPADEAALAKPADAAPAEAPKA